MKSPKEIAAGLTVDQTLEMLRLAIDRLTAEGTANTAAPAARRGRPLSVKGRAMQHARGVYQRKVIDGREALDGSTITGRAAFYGDFYKRSRENLLARLRQEKIPFQEKHGRLSFS